MTISDKKSASTFLSYVKNISLQEDAGHEASFFYQRRDRVVAAGRFLAHCIPYT
jgi:hypothetical protein